MLKVKVSAHEQVATKLLAGQPKAKPYGKLVGNKFVTGTKSLHMTRQSRAWRSFWWLKINMPRLQASSSNFN